MKHKHLTFLLAVLTSMAAGAQDGFLMGDIESPLITSVDQLSSPYTESSEGSLDAMIDGDASTFWHSKWTGTGGSVSAGTHYFEVEVSDMPDEFVISYIRRNHFNDQITKWGIYGAPSSSAAKSKCTLLGTWDSPYTYPGELLVSDVYESQGFTRLRFYCEDSDGGHGFFHVAEFQLYPIVTGHLCYEYSGNEASVVWSPYVGVGEITIPETVTCEGATYSVTSIGSNAFSGCTGLTSISIPESVTTIGGSAFSGCSGLTSISIPESVTSIGNYAFRNCSGLTSITIPESVTSIGEYAFLDCTGLTKAEFASIESLCGINFGDIMYTNPLYYAHHLYIGGEEVKDLVIPESVTSIGSSAFFGCTGLTSITIPESVTNIGKHAFEGCI